MKHRTTGERRIIFFENRRDVHSGARRSRINQNANAPPPPPLFLDQSRSCCICAASGLFPSPGQNIFLLSLVTESFRVSDSPIQRDDNNEGPWTPEQPSLVDVLPACLARENQDASSFEIIEKAREEEITNKFGSVAKITSSLSLPPSVVGGGSAG
jgi:hypothetical protein